MYINIDDDTGKTIGQYGLTTSQARIATCHRTYVTLKFLRSIRGEAKQT